MKKIYILFIISIVQLVGGNNTSNKYIRENAYNYLDYRTKSAIINWESADVQKIKFEEEYFIANEENTPVNIQNKETYIVTFTTNDDILGPIIVYIDQDDSSVLGIDYRE
ncbi:MULTISPECIES: hypothetical protein [unclassified Clostridium]|uniref:hypothetical protein n=1 Tax=unclassified Clostridium TaxID=2614128 RepID=UPI001C8C1B92|nr:MULTISPECIES: hypothetical protein [unclassified Clostridium]MBX9139181.1 hypothetical protein [Clostridium sp. K12(2020)]MBX9145953.1 hypothetical protein [Clostridium sp. K13]MDU2292119.1 hypothetical protein [Clostridium celatum]MDU4327013.1 hypothetical protein [Clostridium celatum]